MEFCGGKNIDFAAYLEKFNKYICWLNIWNMGYGVVGVLVFRI